MTVILYGYLPSQSNVKSQLNIGRIITHAPKVLWHYMMHQWIALYISFPSMYGSAMETSPEKILLHNIPNIRYHVVVIIAIASKDANFGKKDTLDAFNRVRRHSMQSKYNIVPHCITKPSYSTVSMQICT